jgi:hypothetical protein
MATTKRSQVEHTLRFPNQGGGLIATHTKAYSVGQSSSLVAWLFLVGIFIPGVEIGVGALTFTPARLTVSLFFLPAAIALFRSDRKRILCDFFAIATAGWIIMASLINGGFQAYVGAEALEFLGAYLVGRAYFLGRPGIGMFFRVFKVVALMVIVLGFADILSGYPLIGKLLDVPGVQFDIRYGLLRADSVFSVAEHFGTFCVAATALFLFYQETIISRISYVVLSIAGAVASLSSGPLLSLVICVAAFSYDFFLKRITWRWKLMVVAILGLILGAYVISNDPIAFIIGHLTLNPETGNFRIGTWTFGLDLVGLNPVVGKGLASYGAESDLVKLYVGQSVDALWLLLMLRYGVPVVLLLLLTIFIPLLRTHRVSAADSWLNGARTGFSFAVILMALTGLTVHFWDAIWVFFSLCIGIRASFVELDGQQQIRGTSRQLSTL